MRVIKIDTTDIISVIDVDKPLHETLRPVIGGYLEIVRPRGLKVPFVMIVDEEGLLKNKPILNYCGSVLYETHKHGSPIVGDVVIMREEQGSEGYDLAGLTDQDIGEIIPLFRNIIATRGKGAMQ